MLSVTGSRVSQKEGTSGSDENEEKGGQEDSRYHPIRSGVPEPMKEPLKKLLVHKCLLEHSISKCQAGRLLFLKDDATSCAEQVLPVCPASDKNLVPGGSYLPLGAPQRKRATLRLCCVRRGIYRTRDPIFSSGVLGHYPSSFSWGGRVHSMDPVEPER